MGQSCSHRLDLVRRPLAVTSLTVTRDAATQTESPRAAAAAAPLLPHWPSRLNTLTRSREHADVTLFLALAICDAEHQRWLSSPQGLTFVQTRRARGRFRNAVRRVIHRLRLRKAWSAVGKWFQDPLRKDLVHGLTRVQGRLRRSEPAPTVYHTFYLPPP